MSKPKSATHRETIYCVSAVRLGVRRAESRVTKVSSAACVRLPVLPNIAFS